jgi:chaperone modulatory protein CbpM
MRKNINELTGTLLDEHSVFTLRELCRACGVHAELVIDMVEQGVLEPYGGVPTEWRFPGSAVTRAQKALRLSRELHVNWAGTALALDLLEELEQMRRERHVLRRRVVSVRTTRR